MNPIAAAAFKSSSGAWPVGSVIVKEERFMTTSVTAKPDLVGGMIKRAPGYDRLNGDWEYFVMAAGEKLETGRLPDCKSCHRGAPRDRVYARWTG